MESKRMKQKKWNKQKRLNDPVTKKKEKMKNILTALTHHQQPRSSNHN